MTQPDIFTLPPAELRGYARGLREAAAYIPSTGLMGTPTARVGLLREADLVEGFAARLEEARLDPFWPIRKAAAPAAAPPPLYWLGTHPEAEACHDLDDLLSFLPLLEPFEVRSDQRPPQWGMMIPIGEDEREARWFASQADALACSEGWPRDEGEADGQQPTDEEQAQSGLADAVAEDLAQPSTPAPASGETGGASPREQAHALFMTGMKPSDIAAKLSIPKGSVSAWASLHGWRDELAGLKVARANPTPAAADPIKPTPEMLPEDKAEVREKLRTGEFKGAKAIVDYYGCTQQEAQDLIDEHRARMGRAA